jgi:hypothetical protein
MRITLFAHDNFVFLLAAGRGKDENQYKRGKG